VSKKCKDIRQVHGSFASQPNPTGIVDFGPRESAVGDITASDGPAADYLEELAFRSAIHGGVGEAGRSDIPVSATGCDKG